MNACKQSAFIRKGFLIVITILFVLGGSFIVLLVSPAIEAARDNVCQASMNCLQNALRCYAEENGSLPPAYFRGPDGTPWHSWRVFLLPYLGYNDIYKRYRFDEPWNGPRNSKLAEEMDSFYQCPSGDCRGTPFTSYVAITGEGTAFPGRKGFKWDEFKDGHENTILLVEIDNSDIHWMEPRDLSIDTIQLFSQSTNSISSPHPRGPGVVFADYLRVYRLKESIDQADFLALLTPSGGEVVTREDLFPSRHNATGSDSESTALDDVMQEQSGE